MIRTYETDIERGVREMDDLADGYTQAGDYYDGKTPDVYPSTEAERLMRDSRMKDRFRLNFLHSVVVAVTNRLTMTSLESDDTVLAGVVDTLRDSEAEERVHRYACMYGSAYVYVRPPDTDNNAPRFDVNTPLDMHVVYGDDRVPLYAVKRWIEEHRVGDRKEKVTRVDVIYMDRVERYASWRRHDGAPEWVPYTTDGPATIPLPYGVFPVVHFRTDTATGEYGNPEHAGGYGAQDAVNWFSRGTAVLTGAAMFPREYGLIDPAYTLESSENTSRREAFRRFEGYSEVGQFPSINPDLLSGQIPYYVRMIATLTSTPLRFLDAVPQSGVSRVAESALYRTKVLARRASMEASWNVAYRVAATLTGRTVPDSAVLTVSWVPVDDIPDTPGDWAVVRAKTELGVPTVRALIEAGYTQDDAEAFVTEATAGNGPAQRAQYLLTVSEALRNIASAAAAGLLTPESAQRVVAAALDTGSGNPG